MVWAEISSDSRTELTVIENGFLNYLRYVLKILNDNTGLVLMNTVADYLHTFYILLIWSTRIIKMSVLVV